MTIKTVAYQVDPETKCWIVDSHRPNGRGYIYIERDYDKDLIHRIVYRDMHGWIPQYNEVRHSCGEKKCINPEHLYLCEVRNNPAFHRKNSYK